MSTNRPDSARSDQSALAVVWNSTIRPAPRGACVTSGVPSVNAAQVCSASPAPGSASICRLMRTSGGTISPAKGEVVGKGASPAGSLQDKAPPSWRSPPSKRTGSNVSAASDAAMRGPAKRISNPPFSTQAVSAARSAPSGDGLSARIRTDRSRVRRAETSPVRTSPNGAKARFR